MKQLLALRRSSSIAVSVFLFVLLTGACQKEAPREPGGPPARLADVPSVRLSYRYEPDVPQPETAGSAALEERNPAVQADFDLNRPGEALDRTLTSPDKKRVLAVYHQADDLSAEFRLDMYSPDGKLLQKVTADLMAVHFPDTIVWSPDSANVAFVAMIRGAQGEKPELPADIGTKEDEAPATKGSPSNTNTSAVTDTNSNTGSADGETNAETAPAEPVRSPTPTAPTGILTFRTEQIYLCDADGGNLKPLTQNEGLIYFYYTWSPDSSALAALAATAREWQYLQFRADNAGEIFVPVGRPRMVEKNGRERRLDDALTAVRPVWSPDSAKIAAAFESQVRIYDAVGTNPTQAAVPLRNSLLLSSQAYDLEQHRTLGGANTDTNVNAAAPASSTLPDEKSLVSFNPIVTMAWPEDQILYFQTAFIKRMKNEADSVTSFPRWHRLVLSPQAAGRTN